MEAATAANLTQASEIAGRYMTLGSRLMISKGIGPDREEACTFLSPALYKIGGFGLAGLAPHHLHK